MATRTCRVPNASAKLLCAKLSCRRPQSGASCRWFAAHDPDPRKPRGSTRSPCGDRLQSASGVWASGIPAPERLHDLRQPLSVDTARRDIVSPRLHQRAPQLEQVASHVGRLDAIGVDVGERQFADLARRVRALGAPIPKAAAESMDNRWNALLPEQLRKGVVRERPPRDARKDPAGAVGPIAGFGQDLQCPPAERYPVLALHLHSVGRNRPDCGLEVDFIPPGLPHLARARGG